jgi:cytochrome P450
VTGVLELIGFLGDPDFVRRRFDRYGDVFETVLAGQPQIFVKGAEAAGELLAQSEALEGWWPSTVRQLLGELSLSSRNGEAHLARRRAVGQLFTAAALRTYVPGITALCDGLVAELAAAEGPVALVERMRPFAFAVIAQVVLGLGAAEQKALFDDFELWSGGLFTLPLAWPGTPLARAKGARKRLLRQIRALLPSIEPLKGARDEAGLPLSDDDLVEQLLLLLFAGYETTASSLGCLLLMLLQHPEAIDWLQEEIDALPWPLASYELEQLERAERLDAVLKEVMRLIPPVGGLFRRTTAPVHLLGYAIPAGRVIQVNLSGTHGDPRVYEMPEQFQADRHLRHPLKAPGYIPFGGGPRVCLGRPLAELEVRLLAVRLLQTLRFTLTPRQDLSLETIPTPRPRDGLLVTVKRRGA